jgi:hypothetical protein
MHIKFAGTICWTLMSVYSQATQFMSSSTDVHTDCNESHALAQSSGNADVIQLVLQEQQNLILFKNNIRPQHQLNMIKPSWKLTISIQNRSLMWDLSSHNGDYTEYHLLRCDAFWKAALFRSPMFCRRDHSLTMEAERCMKCWTAGLNLRGQLPEKILSLLVPTEASKSCTNWTV